MQFDTTLNVTWLLLGLTAFFATIATGIRRADRRASAWLHIVGVALIVAALFPYISATDDSVQLEQFHAQHDRHHSGKQSQKNDLIRLYETMDSPLLCRTHQVAITLCFVSLVQDVTITCVERIAPLVSGRSPPLAIA